MVSAQSHGIRPLEFRDRSIIVTLLFLSRCSPVAALLSGAYEHQRP
jgi:hypothetical protein